MTVLTKQGALKRVSDIRALAASIRDGADRSAAAAEQSDDDLMKQFLLTNAENGRLAADAFEKDAGDLEKLILKE